MCFEAVAVVSILLAPSRSLLSSTQMLTIFLCSAVGVLGGLSAGEVQCRAQTKTLPDWCWVGAGFPCHPIHVVLLQGRGQAGVLPAETLGKEREEEWDSRARETECTGAGKALATLMDSKRKSEKDPVSQERQQVTEQKDIASSSARGSSSWTS